MTPSPELCARCGEPLPERARFCPNCGAPVLSEARERKLVSIVFVDLTASTELAARLDPERFREVLSAFYQLISGEMVALRGRPEQYVGDAVMGVFGVPAAHDDDAVRAIRAGLSIADRSEKLGVELGLPMPMRVRVGVNTGPVAVGAGSGPGLVSGAEVNLAARLQQAAEPGEMVALRGRPEQYVGDAVMGVFGVPAAHDDDAVRAIRAGLSIVDRSEKLGVELGLPMPMRVRVGVNTGPVAVGAGSGPGLVSGAEVNLAARLQQAAEPGEVLVSATTRQLARQQVEFGERRMIQAKGFAGEIPAWPAIRIAPASARKSIPLVDRRRELALLTDTFERVVEHERAHLVTLLGEPGIGKSRVVEEFLAQVPEETKVMTGRSSAFEERVTFWPVAQMVLREIGEEGDAPSERILERLADVVGSLVDADDLARSVRGLGLAIGIGEEEDAGEVSPGAEVRAGLLSIVSGMTRSGPVVLVFEDLHEADPDLLDLIEQLVRDARRLPLLVICVARWEFLEDRPGWAGGIPDAVSLWVESLPQVDAVQLARESGDLEDDEAVRVADHTGGNPFFIVEITGMLRHDGRGGPGPAGAPPLPATVQAVIASRIDELSAPARGLLRCAAIFARGAFDVSELELLTDPDPHLLEELEDEEFLVRDDERPSVWRFRSDVLRDVAYESLAKRERQRLHLRLATRLAEPGTAAHYPRSIAYHLEQAGRSALDLNPNDRSLAERAVEALAHAGDLARRRVESRSATDLYERALALAGPDAGWGRREGAILASLGESRYWLGEFHDAEAALTRALDVAGDDAEVRSHAGRFLADITLTVRGEPGRAWEQFQAAINAARRLGDARVLSRTLLMAGWVPFWGNDLVAAREMFEEALDVARSIDTRDAWAEARALVGLAAIVSPEGDEREALSLAEEALRIGEESGQAFTAAVASENVGSSLRRMLRLDEASEHVNAAVRTFRELGARWELASALGDRGVVHRLAGRLEEGEQDLREAFRLCRDLGERALVTWTAAELARLLVARADLSGARHVLDDAALRAASSHPRWSYPALLTAESAFALAERDEELARAKALAGIEEERSRHGEGGNALAAQVWWAARLFDEEAGGGAAAVRAARERLERNAWHQALREPDFLLEQLGR